MKKIINYKNQNIRINIHHGVWTQEDIEEAINDFFQEIVNEYNFESEHLAYEIAGDYNSIDMYGLSITGNDYELARNAFFKEVN